MKNWFNLNIDNVLNEIDIELEKNSNDKINNKKMKQKKEILNLKDYEKEKNELNNLLNKCDFLNNKLKIDIFNLNNYNLDN